MATANDSTRSRHPLPGADQAPPTRAEIEDLYHSARLSLPAGLRLPMASTMSFLAGFTLGTAQGGKMAGLRFRAEHAHKLPTTTTGWFLYHKSKNYHLAYGGIREGFRMGFRVCFWTTAMFAIEQMFDSYRGTADFVNTVTSCVTVAGLFSLRSTSMPSSDFAVFCRLVADAATAPQIVSRCQ